MLTSVEVTESKKRAVGEGLGNRVGIVGHTPMGCRNSDTPGEAGCARYYLNAQWIELPVNADDRWPSRKLSRVNTQPFHSCDQRGSFEAHAGGSAVCSTHSSLGLFQDSQDFVLLAELLDVCGRSADTRVR